MPVNTVRKQRLGISHIWWQNLAEVSTNAVITLVAGGAKGKEMTAQMVGPSFAGELPGTLVVSGYLLS